MGTAGDGGLGSIPLQTPRDQAMEHTPLPSLCRPWTKGKLPGTQPVSPVSGRNQDLLALNFHGLLSPKHPAVFEIRELFGGSNCVGPFPITQGSLQQPCQDHSNAECP